jgi:hypothetical protein
MASQIVRAIVSLCFGICVNGTLGQTSRAAAEQSNEELIDRLQYVNEKSYSVQTNIIAAAGPLPQGQRFQQEGPSEPSAAMQELVRRGPSAVAGLCEHLTDARKTHSVIAHPTDYSAEYDWNPRTQSRAPGTQTPYEFGRTTPRIVGAPSREAYPIAVGDICFELLGQIVNRDYRAARYQMSGMIIINSPVLVPDLAAAVRKGWEKITPEQLCASLIKDIEQPDRADRAEVGIITLARYFPNSVSAAVRARLKLPTYDAWAVQYFVDGSVLPDGSTDSREKKIAAFLSANPVGYHDAMLVYLWPYRSQEAQAALIKELGGTLDADRPPMPSAMDIRWNADFVDALSDIHLPEVEAAVYSEFGGRHHETGQALTSNDYIAMACIKHLVHTGHDPEFMAYCRRRLNAVTDKWDKVRMQQILDAITVPAEK